MRNKTINIFCSISKSRTEEINNLLIPSLEKQTTDYKIHLSLIDYTGKNTVLKKDIKSKTLKFNVLNSKNSFGFGETHNYAFNKIKPETFFIIINPDIYLDENCIKELISSFAKEVGIVEARQQPFAHPKDLPNEKTFETNWASGCCMLINTKFFKSIKGFDPNYWMYLEDVDLSWKSWINGYKVLQNPNAIVNHYTGAYFKYSENSYELEHFWSTRNYLYFSYVYFGQEGLDKAYKDIKEIPLDENLKKEAIVNFEELRKSIEITRIEIPHNLKKKLRIYDFNKFSKYPI